LFNSNLTLAGELPATLRRIPSKDSVAYARIDNAGTDKNTDVFISVRLIARSGSKTATGRDTPTGAVGVTYGVLNGLAYNTSGRVNASNNNRSNQKSICRFASCYLSPELEGRYFGLFDGRRAHGAGRR
jgi:hypothetical protein